MGCIVYNGRNLSRFALSGAEALVFERRYGSLVSSAKGALVIYYAARATHNGGNYYAVARIGDLFPHPAAPTQLFATVSEYGRFPAGIPAFGPSRGYENALFGRNWHSMVQEQCVRSRMPRRLPFSKTWICPVLPLLMTAWQRIPRVTSTNRAGSMSSAEQRGGCNCGNRQDWNMVVVVASRAAGRKTEAGNLRRSVATYGRCMRVVRMRSGMPSCSGDPCIGRSINI